MELHPLDIPPPGRWTGVIDVGDAPGSSLRMVTLPLSGKTIRIAGFQMTSQVVLLCMMLRLIMIAWGFCC